MARPSKALLRFVELYVNGPAHVQGQWNKCANAANMKEPPSREDVMVRRLVEKAGGVVTSDDAPPVAVALDPLERVLAVGDTEVIPWKQLRGELKDVIKSIATGEVQARAAQVAVLKMIIEKAEKAAAEEEEIHCVIVVPTQGKNQTLMIDEDWMRKIKSMQVPDEIDETQSRSGMDTEQGTANSVSGSDS